MIRPYNFGDQYTEDVGRVGAGIRDVPGLHVYYGLPFRNTERTDRHYTLPMRPRPGMSWAVLVQRDTPTSWLSMGLGNRRNNSANIWLTLDKVSVDVENTHHEGKPPANLPVVCWFQLDIGSDIQLKINGSKVVTTSPVPPTYFDTMWNVMNIAGTNYNNFDVMELHLTTLKTPGTASTMANVIFTASGNRPLKEYFNLSHPTRLGTGASLTLIAKNKNPGQGITLGVDNRHNNNLWIETISAANDPDKNTIVFRKGSKTCYFLFEDIVRKGDRSGTEDYFIMDTNCEPVDIHIHTGLSVVDGYQP